MNPFWRNIHLRVLACILTMLAVLSHGLPASYHAKAAAAPDLSVYADLDTNLAADLMVICHTSSSTSNEDGSGSSRAPACPLCKILCGGLLAAPSDALALDTPLMRRDGPAQFHVFTLARPWPQRPPPGRGPPQLS